MTRGDTLVDKGADRLEKLSADAAASGGLKAKLAQPLAEDAEFLRKLKPSLIKERAKGNLPTDQKPNVPPASPPGPQLGERPKPPKPPKEGGPNPWLVVGAAFAAGIFLAKWIDWRGHAHPKR